MMTSQPNGPQEESVSSEVVLDLQDICKQFGPVRANHNISLELHRGEVLALLGENGAGKTTLMSILFGEYTADYGSIFVFGKRLPPGSPHAALEAGIGLVHQHFELADNISVLDNIMIGTESAWSLLMRRREGRERLEELMQKSGLHVDLDGLVANLTVGQRQRVEILKALYVGARILILDEPTAVLTPQETDQLFATIRDLVREGMSVIFISHKLKEVMAISNRIIVLRAGEIVFETRTADTNALTLAERMVGRELAPRQPLRLPPGEPVLVMSDATVEEKGRATLRGVNLEVRRSEVVGIAGVSGNGQQPLFEVISGLRRLTSGSLTILGQSAERLTPAEVVELGVGRIPEDRLRTGVVGDLSIWANIAAETYRRPESEVAGFVRRQAIVERSRRIIEKYDVRCPSPNVAVRLLSGGNIQKLIVGRNLSREPALIVASQPTRGLDVGAVAFVHDQLEEAKKRGAAVLLISDDLDELLALSDRIVVAFDGTISAAIPRDEVVVEQLGLMMMGQTTEGMAA